MDELTIDDKKFISSKRAAEITGYAKDYVGQLCRDGYVDARRIGRNWYVLEAAIKDHRFGSGQGPEDGKGAPILTWESPHYEAVPVKNIAPVELRRPAKTPEDVSLTAEQTENAVSATAPSREDLHDAWQEWFDMFRPHAPEADTTVEQRTLPGSEDRNEANEGDRAYADRNTEDVQDDDAASVAIEVPVRILEDAPQEKEPYRSDAAPQELLTPVHRAQRASHGSLGGRARTGYVLLRVSLITLALISFGIAAIGTDYLGFKSISSIRVPIISGVDSYKK